ncbi:MAG: branched-chain amino acid ABC transporter substrate-binding protein [Cyanobacteria bacterium]|nr:branched-chain amino acid ABC transporter substrate-binding protein [Cyanobacteriota bacterium]
MKKNILISTYIILLILSIVLSLNISGCSQRERIIKIGSQSVFSGDFKNIGQEQLVSINLAAKELAPVRVGGFDYKISIISKDDEGSAEKSYLVSQEMVQENASAVIGSSFNATTKAALPIYQEFNIPMVTPSASGADLSKSGSNFFRMIINNNQVIENVAIFIVSKYKPVKMVIINTGSEYELNFVDYLENTLKSISSQQINISRKYTIKPETEDYNLLAENLLIDDADLIFFCGEYNTLAKILTAARKAGVTANFLTEKLGMDEGISQLADPKTLEGLTAIVPQPPSLAMFSEDPKAQEFWRKFKDMAPQIKGIDIRDPGQFAPYAYDAFYVLIEAMKKANSVQPEDYIDVLRNTAFDGITGHIEFDSNGNLKNPQSTVFIMKNGTWIRFQK